MRFPKSLRGVVTQHDTNTVRDETFSLIDGGSWPACVCRTQQELSLLELVVYVEMSDDLFIVVINSIECVNCARLNMI